MRRWSVVQRRPAHTRQMAVISPVVRNGEEDMEYPNQRARRIVGATAVLAAIALVGACSTSRASTPSAASSSSGSVHAGHGFSAPPAAPLRPGERFVNVTMPQPYTPAAPNGGTDEYRCFLVDPGLTSAAFLTGSQFLPQNADIVHHAIFFRVDPAGVDAARQADARPHGARAQPRAAAASLNTLSRHDAAPVAGATQHCDHKVRKARTVYALAGHMHLLGRSIKVELNPGTPTAQTLLDIPTYNFDDQGMRPLAKPVTVKPGDTYRVTCTHDVSLRKQLPQLHGLPARYVVWGDGTSDEMCLGLVTWSPAP